MVHNDYRIGDVVAGRCGDSDGAVGLRRRTLGSHPDTILSEYISRTADDVENDYNTLAQICDVKCKEVPSEAAVLHLRLGDAACWKESGVSPAPTSAVARVVEDNVASDTPIRIIANIGRPEHNGDACLKESKGYLSDVMALLPNATSAPSAHPDVDFCTLVNAEVFVAGRGGFSEMADHVRKQRGKSSIVHPDISGWT